MYDDWDDEDDLLIDDEYDYDEPDEYPEYADWWDERADW